MCAICLKSWGWKKEEKEWGYLEEEMSDPVARSQQGTMHIKPLQINVIETVLAKVMEEILRQDILAREGKFGGTHVLPGGPNDARLRVLMEEVGEVARELNERDQGHWEPRKLLDELIQTAACAVSFAAAHIEEENGYRP